MIDTQSNSSQVAASWDSYWRGTGDISAYSIGGVSHPAIQAFWDDFFQSAVKKYSVPMVIDIASGNGAVLERALATFGKKLANFTCVDISEASITNIRSRFPVVQSLVADARSIPLESEKYDIVTSQFGVEYAGLEAIDEAARLLATGGRLALLLHNQDSSIHRECTASLAAIAGLQESKFIPYSMQLFEAGFAACGGADRALYEAAATQLAPAVKALEAIMTEYGEHVAGDTIVRLYSDVNRIHQNIQRHDPNEVMAWLSRMDGELEAYAGRMSSMSAAAIDSEAFNLICDGLNNLGCSTIRAEPLEAEGHDLPLAWVLVATRGHWHDTLEPEKSERPFEVDFGALDDHPEDKLQVWIKMTLKTAVNELIKSDVFSNLLIEAKPAWMLPFQILIGKVRQRGQAKKFFWVICGEVPTDYLLSTTASSPREAARYFALKWQGQAAQYLDEASGRESPGPMEALIAQVRPTVAQAEGLYGLVEDDRLWPQ